MRARHGLRDWLSLGALVAVWGTAFAFIRLAVESVPPASVAAGRIVAAALVLLGAVGFSRLRLPTERRVWAWFLLLGLVGNVLPFFLISWGQQQVESGVAGILMAVNPLATLLLAHFFVVGERLTATRALGFLLGFAGVVVLLGVEAFAHVAGGSLLHRAAVLTGAVVYGERPGWTALAALALVLAGIALSQARARVSVE